MVSVHYSPSCGAARGRTARSVSYACLDNAKPSTGSRPMPSQSSQAFMARAALTRALSSASRTRASSERRARTSCDRVTTPYRTSPSAGSEPRAYASSEGTCRLPTGTSARPRASSAVISVLISSSPAGLRGTGLLSIRNRTGLCRSGLPCKTSHAGCTSPAPHALAPARRRAGLSPPRRTCGAPRPPSRPPPARRLPRRCRACTDIVRLSRLG